MRLVIYVVLLLLSQYLIGCQKTEKQAANLEVLGQPAEFEAQEALWVIWPQTDHKEGFSNEEVSLQIIEAVSFHQKVWVACADSSIYHQASSRLDQTKMPRSNISLVVIPSMEFWVRDMGPSFVETDQGLAVVDFQFDSWGYSDTTDAYSKTEGRFDRMAAKLLDVPVISTSLISEGGNREVNGKGVLMLSERVEKGRNPDWSLKQMEAEYRHVLGVKEIIWLGEGVVEDDHTFLGPLSLKDGLKAYTVVTTDGHTDEFARFVNDSTLVLAYIPEEDMEDPLAMENHERMEENLHRIQQAVKEKKLNIHIQRMPLPKTMIYKMGPGDSVYDYISSLDYQDGSKFPVGDSVNVVAAGSYLNFTITNKVVLGQKFWREGLDDEIRKRDLEVEQQLKSLFPNRKVVMIDATAVNLGGGGIHCITMHQPIKPNELQ